MSIHSIIKGFLVITLFLETTGICFPGPIPVGINETPSPQDYILNRLTDHDIVFLGTTHRKPQILEAIARLLPYLSEAGVTHVALEISTDQQPHIDRYLNTGAGLAEIELHSMMACQKYRDIFRVVTSLDKRTQPGIIAIDLPPVCYGKGISRNEWMACSLAEIFRKDSCARVLVILGSRHVLRKLAWEHHIRLKEKPVRDYLTERIPYLRMFSIVNIISESDADCDFSRALSGLSGAVALDVDKRHQGWRLGLLRCMAVKPVPVQDLVDGVIVY